MMSNTTEMSPLPDPDDFSTGFTEQNTILDDLSSVFL